MNNSRNYNYSQRSVAGVTSIVQPPLASSAAEDHFQDRGLCMEYGNVSMASHRPIYRHPCLQSASTGGVELPRVLTSTGQRSFSFHGPTVWNRLPSALRDGSLSLNTFTRQLKSYLFGQ